MAASRCSSLTVEARVRQRARMKRAGAASRERSHPRQPAEHAGTVCCPSAAAEGDTCSRRRAGSRGHIAAARGWDMHRGTCSFRPTARFQPHQTAAFTCPLPELAMETRRFLSCLMTTAEPRCGRRVGCPPTVLDARALEHRYFARTTSGRATDRNLYPDCGGQMLTTASPRGRGRRR